MKFAYSFSKKAIQKFLAKFCPKFLSVLLCRMVILCAKISPSISQFFCTKSGQISVRKPYKFLLWLNSTFPNSTFTPLISSFSLAVRSHFEVFLTSKTLRGVKFAIMFPRKVVKNKKSSQSHLAARIVVLTMQKTCDHRPCPSLRN